MAKSKQAHQEPLTLETFALLANGQARATINAALAAALRDTEDRGGDKKPRKVTIDVVFVKAGDDHVAATVKAKTTLPPYVTMPTIGTLQVDGRNAQMLFSPAAADNPDQPGLPGTGDE